MNTTINYYNLNVKNFIENTQNADMHLAQEKLLQLLPGSASILDFGCGSGRDTKYFLEKGYQVAATDGSAELCRLAGSFTSWCSDSHSYWQLLRNYTAFCTISS